MNSSLFDANFYLRTYPDVASATSGNAAAAELHFLTSGRFEGRAPTPFFDPQLYLAANPDVADALANGAIASAFDHFQLFGVQENRVASAFFDAARYLEQNPDVEMAVHLGIVPSAFDHFVHFGMLEGRDSSVLFDTDYYLASNPDVAEALAAGTVGSALQHFMLFGREEHRDTSPFFDLAGYLDASPDVADAVARGLTDPYTHLLVFGIHEGRDLGNGLSLASFAADPTAQAAIAAGDLDALFARIAAVAPFMPGFAPSSGYDLPANMPLPLDFVPVAGQTLAVPAGMVLPAGTVLPAAFGHSQPQDGIGGAQAEPEPPAVHHPPNEPSQPRPEAPQPEHQAPQLPNPGHPGPEHPQPEPPRPNVPHPTQPEPKEPSPDPKVPDPKVPVEHQPAPPEPPPISTVSPSQPLTMLEDGGTAKLFATHPIVGEPETGTTIRAELNLPTSNQGTLQIDGTEVSGVGGHYVVTGSVAQVNAALASLVFRPAPDFHDVVRFQLVVWDGPKSSQGGVSIEVQSVNDDPVARDDAFETGFNEEFTLKPDDLLANDHDVDGPSLHIKALGEGQHGSVSFNEDGVIVFTPEAGYAGPAGFSYEVADDAGGSASGDVVVTIRSQNQSPVAAPDTFETDEDQSLEIEVSKLLSNDKDLDGGTLTLVAVRPVEGGSVVLNEAGTAVLFTPAKDGNGASVFEYEVKDGQGGTSTGIVTVDVQPVNDAPTLTSAYLSYSYAGPNMLLQAFSISDVDGNEDKEVLTLSVSEGSILLRDADTYARVGVENNNSSSLTLRGSVDDLNALFVDAEIFYNNGEVLDHAVLLRASVRDEEHSDLFSEFTAQILPGSQAVDAIVETGI